MAILILCPLLFLPLLSRIVITTIDLERCRAVSALMGRLKEGSDEQRLRIKCREIWRLGLHWYVFSVIRAPTHLILIFGIIQHIDHQPQVWFTLKYNPNTDKHSTFAFYNEIFIFFISYNTLIRNTGNSVLHKMLLIHSINLINSQF